MECVYDKGESNSEMCYDRSHYPKLLILKYKMTVWTYFQSSSIVIFILIWWHKLCFRYNFDITLICCLAAEVAEMFMLFNLTFSSDCS